jgi:hypothetical protein
VHERNLRPGRVDGRAVTRNVGQRFATERSPEGSQKNQEHRRTLRHAPERLGQCHAAVTALCDQAASLRASS